MSNTIDTALLAGGPLLPKADLEPVLGWQLKPEGLCQGDICVPVHDMAALCPDDNTIDLLAVAGLVDRPAAVDETTGLVAIGAPRASRRSAINDLQAPEFTLPDLDGSLASLSDFAGKKKLLVAFSSW